MPASKSSLRRPSKVIVFIALVAVSLPQAGLLSSAAAKETTPVSAALNWLVQRQQADGSYGAYTEHQTAAAADALLIGMRRSPSVSLAYNWLKGQIDSSGSWFWGSFGEADVPGAVLHSFDATRQVGQVNLSTVAHNLQSFRQLNGGFKGYYDPALATQVTSSVDTAEALWGLIGAKSITATDERSAVSYLFSLQKSDGSFNLTSTVVSDALYSLGPEPISITALVTLVLKDASFTVSDTHVSSALSFLDKAASANFSGHVYAAALCALAFRVFHDPMGVSEALGFILSHQKVDGGFSDASRSSSSSNALDTGWAAIALQLAQHGSPRDITGPRSAPNAVDSGLAGALLSVSSEGQAAALPISRVLETSMAEVAHYTIGLLHAIVGLEERVLIRSSLSFDFSRGFGQLS